MGRDAFNFDTPMAGAFARGFAGQALRRFQHVNGCAPTGKALRDGPRNGTSYLFVGVEKEDDFTLQKAGLNEHFNGGKGHGYAGFHVQRSRAPRSEEHTSELQSLRHLVCRLLLEKKKKN